MTNQFDMQTIMAHIKNLSPDTMTVFITEPFEWESKISNLPYTAGDKDRFTFDGERLTARGHGRAKEALEYMTKVALFYVAHKDELKPFYAEYDAEYATLLQALNAVNEKKRTTKEIRGRLALIRQQFEIEDNVTHLFNNMYRDRFGEEVPIIHHDLFRECERLSR